MFNLTRAARFLNWAHATFGECALNRTERAMRLLEEAMELAQVEGVTEEVSQAMARRVWSRTPGDLSTEIGQVQATLETLACNVGANPDLLAEAEWYRVLSKPGSHWRARHNAKTAVGITTDSRR